MTLKYTPAFLDQLRSRTSLVSIISRKTRLIRAGKLFKGPCPFHREKSPSFVVYEDQGTYHCFGCGAHGDAISFLTATEGYSFAEAVAELARQAGVPLPEKEHTHETNGPREPRLPLRECLEAATAWYEAQFFSPNGEKARSYLARRMFKDETIRKFRLGYAPSGNRLREFLLKTGFSPDTLRETGLAIQEDGKGEIYDRFRDRLMFPICDRQGRIIGFGGRILGAGEPKYLNSPETSLFHKGHELYGFHLARKHDFSHSPPIACEGYTDVLALHQSGYGGAVASLGTALTEHQIELLWRLGPEPVLCFDGDPAGQKAAWRAAERALPVLKAGYTLGFVTMPGGEDPASLLEKGKMENLGKILEKKVALADLLWHKETLDQAFVAPEKKALLQKKLLEHAGRIRDSSLQGFYREYFRNRMFDYFRSHGRGKPGTPMLQRPRLDVHERRQGILMLTIVHYPQILHEVLEPFTLYEFKGSEPEAMRDAILEQFNLHPELDSMQLKHHLCSIGFEEALEKFSADARLHAPFAAPGGSAADALKGWLGLLELCQGLQGQQDESRYLSKEFSREMSRDFWEKIQNIKKIHLLQQKKDVFES